MPKATTTRVIARIQKPSSAISLSEMTMISAERMKSVRMAPPTILSSWFSPLIAAGASFTLECPLTASQIFSAPSYER